MLKIARTAVYDTAAKRALLRDRFWVREPYVEFSPAKFGCPGHLHAIVPGNSPNKLTIPPELKPYVAVLKMTRFTGEGMRRVESRAQLEIMCILADKKGFQCRVHMAAVGQRAA